MRVVVNQLQFRAEEFKLTVQLYCHKQQQRGLEISRILNVDFALACDGRLRGRMKGDCIARGALFLVFDKVMSVAYHKFYFVRHTATQNRAPERQYIKALPQLCILCKIC